jgi:hypothetical protein
MEKTRGRKSRPTVPLRVKRNRLKIFLTTASFSSINPTWAHDLSTEILSVLVTYCIPPILKSSGLCNFFQKKMFPLLMFLFGILPQVFQNVSLDIQVQNPKHLGVWE